MDDEQEFKIKHSKIMICAYKNYLDKKCKKFNYELEKKIMDNSGNWIQNMEEQVQLTENMEEHFKRMSYNEEDYMFICKRLKDEVYSYNDSLQFIN